MPGNGSSGRSWVGRAVPRVGEGRHLAGRRRGGGGRPPMPGNGSSGRSWVGRSVPRVEDARHLTGRGMFVGDIERPRMLYAAFARSPFGAARVEKVSIEDAIGVSGGAGGITRSGLGGVAGG